MSPVEVAGTSLFFVVLFLGIFLIPLGFPGTVIIFAAVVLYALFTGFSKIELKVIFILLFISVLAEILDFAIGVMGAVKFGASKEGVLFSIIGGFLCAIIMTPVFYGIGAIAGSFLGGFIGIVIYETIKQSRLKPAFRAGYGAIAGRFAGMLVKGILAFTMIIIIMSNIYS